MFLGNHYNFIVPALVFEFNILIVFLILWIHWAYATHKGRLIEESLDKKTLSKHRNIGLFIIIFTLFAIALTFLNNYFKR
jgi:uncharacterized membrane protein